MTDTIKTQDAVLLHVRHGEEIRTQTALILDVDNIPSLFGSNGQPSVEVILVNPVALRHAGTADWHLSLQRFVSVVHVSNQAYVDGKLGMGYEELPTGEAVANVLQFKLAEATALVNFFGGDEDSEVSVVKKDDGLYVWATDYPEDGALNLSTGGKVSPFTKDADVSSSDPNTIAPEAAIAPEPAAPDADTSLNGALQSTTQQAAIDESATPETASSQKDAPIEGQEKAAS
jgi:hypothetical protein